jgi:hypothetical protein
MRCCTDNVGEEPAEGKESAGLTGINQGSKDMCLKHLASFFNHKYPRLDTL